VGVHCISSSTCHILNAGDDSKKIITKVVKALNWDNKLLGFVRTFAKRRKDFEFALNIHATVAIDTTRLKVDVIAEQTAEIVQKYVIPIIIVERRH
jgi:hypothetical protein